MLTYSLYANNGILALNLVTTLAQYFSMRYCCPKKQIKPSEHLPIAQYNGSYQSIGDYPEEEVNVPLHDPLEPVAPKIVVPFPTAYLLASTAALLLVNIPLAIIDANYADTTTAIAITAAGLAMLATKQVVNIICITDVEKLERFSGRDLLQSIADSQGSFGNGLSYKKG